MIILGLFSQILHKNVLYVFDTPQKCLLDNNSGIIFLISP